jgi:hypothetical protein
MESARLEAMVVVMTARPGRASLFMPDEPPVGFSDILFFSRQPARLQFRNP